MVPNGSSLALNQELANFPHPDIPGPIYRRLLGIDELPPFLDLYNPTGLGSVAIPRGTIWMVPSGSSLVLNQDLANFPQKDVSGSI